MGYLLAIAAGWFSAAAALGRFTGIRIRWLLAPVAALAFAYWTVEWTADVSEDLGRAGTAFITGLIAAGACGLCLAGLNYGRRRRERRRPPGS